MRKDDSYYLYLKDLEQLKKYSKGVNEDLIEKFYQEKDKTKRDKELRKKLIENNLALVIFIINKYYSETLEKFDIGDLINSGNIGLIKGIDNYNPSSGYTLSTYLSNCILNEIKIYLSYINSIFSASFGTRENINRYKRKKEAITKNTDLSINEVSEKLNMKISVVSSYERYLNAMTLSINSNIENTSFTYEEVLKKENSDFEFDIINKYGYDELINIIKDFYDSLNDYDKIIFYKRVFEHKTFVQIADELKKYMQSVQSTYKKIKNNLNNNYKFKRYKEENNI